MHLIVLFAIFGLAWGLRYTWDRTTNSDWSDSPEERLRQRWQLTLSKFLLPPLLLFTTSIAIILMGPHGRMVWVGNDWLSYSLAIGCLGFAGIYLLKLTFTGWQILQEVRIYPITKLGEKTVRIINLPTPYIAQVGFWEPQLIVTQGLLDNLDAKHLAAVLAHEQAHYCYRDNWYFFWLGWIRQITILLPQTESIWQELLLLRELRADRWASQQTDPLLVAEALLLVVQNTSIFSESFFVGFSQIAPPDRLTQRIDALLEISQLTNVSTQKPQEFNSRREWGWLLWGFIPLLTVFFHQ